jgi:hypothetical protein
MAINATIKLVNTQLANLSPHENKYYVTGIIFMVLIMGLLIYVNFFYEYSLSELTFKIFDNPLCCCFKLIICKCVFMYKFVNTIMNDDDFFKDISSNNTNNRNSNESSGNGLVRVNEINHNQIDIVCIDENKK